MTLLSLHNISIEFPGVKALTDVCFDLYEGQIHALVGENGAGKSTLIKIIGGVWTTGMYKGYIRIDGKDVSFHSVRDSENAQIQIIHQELSLVNQMTVAENIFLGNEPTKFGLIDYTAMNVKSQQTIRLLSSTINPHDIVADLTIGEQQIVEIAKALSKKARILVFDEPTAALPERDVENLLRLVVELKKKGLGIIYISHKLKEVCSIADTVTVLRNGRVVSRFTRENLRIDYIVRDMIGRSLENAFPQVIIRKGDNLLSLKNITLRDPHHRARTIIQNINMTVHRGEVVGIAGLLGSGRTALLSMLFGVYRGGVEGEIKFESKFYIPSSPADALQRGIALVTEDRKQFGLIGTADVKENLLVASLYQFCRFRLINHSMAFAASNRYVRELNIKTPSLEFAAVNLSGGNQQKVIVGRFLMTLPKLLLLDEPTRGIDVGTKYEIYKLIQSLASQGIGIIFASSELAEVLGVSHRIYVLQGGKLRAEFSHGERTEEETLALAAGI